MLSAGRWSKYCGRHRKSCVGARRSCARVVDLLVIWHILKRPAGSYRINTSLHHYQASKSLSLHIKAEGLQMVTKGTELTIKS